MMLMSTLNRFLTGSENEWNFQIWVLYLGLKQKKNKIRNNFSRKKFPVFGQKFVSTGKW